jgi:hypothetical protein
MVDPEPSGPTTYNWLGDLQINEKEGVTGQTKNLELYFRVKPHVQLPDGALILNVIDPQNKVTFLTSLYDDGELAVLDEIKGDGIHSGKASFSPTQAGTYTLRVMGSLFEGGDQIPLAESNIIIWDPLASGSLREVYDLQHQAAQLYEEALQASPGDIENGVKTVKTWLSTLPAVLAVDPYSDASFELKMRSGLTTLLSFQQRGSDNMILYKGGNLDSIPRRKKAVVPLAQQTRGKAMFDQISASLRNDISFNQVGNRKILLYAPFEEDFGPDESKILNDVVNKVDCGIFPLTILANEEATVESIKTFIDYGAVVISSHGAMGADFVSGEKVDSTTTLYKNKYQGMIQSGSLKIYIPLVLRPDGTVEQNGDIKYIITHKFIDELEGRFPSSFIFNSSCESTLTNALENAFLSKGASSYLGFSRNVSNGFAKAVLRIIMEELLLNGTTTGEISVLNVPDPNTPPPKSQAVLELKGSPDLHYSYQLENGGFEFGFQGWTPVGDGRVISRLGPLLPSEGELMGIISTGLGFTKDFGTIYQDVTIPGDKSVLELSYNFLSEEFLDYIGTQYQDGFRVAVKPSFGPVEPLYQRSIDDIAAELGATKSNQGQLIRTPDIYFDQGEVYMTGFRTISIDVSAYQGQCITLLFQCWDVGDSLYDSAVLLDAITYR